MIERPKLTVEIYSTGTTPIYDASGELLDGRDLWYETCFPGGKYLAGGIFISKDPSKWWEVKGTLRVVVRSGLNIVYEGKIPNLQSVMSESEEGVQINFMGCWGADLATKNWRKRWADDRTDESTWPYETTTTGVTPELAFLDRRERIKFTPKAEAWADGDFVAVTYTMPYDQTVARIVYNCAMAEAAQSWEVSLWRSADGSSWTQMTNASGEIYNLHTTTVVNATTSPDIDIDVEPASGTRYLQFRYYSRAAQTPTSDNTYYASITGMTVYSEEEFTDTITLFSICEDIIDVWSDVLNSSIAYLHTPSNARTLEPFITSGDSFEPLTSILMGAAAPGDDDDNRMSVGVLHSEMVPDPDGLPILYTSEYPDTTSGYDYILYPDGNNIVGTLTLTRDYDADLYNFIQIEYINKDGIRKYLDPNETTTLKDADSITDYGERHLLLRLGHQTAATAQEIGEKWLAAKKSPPWLASFITVQGYILDDYDREIPACNIEACDYEGVGKRLKVDGYDTFIISRTRYDYESDTTRINIGPIEDPLYQQQEWDPEFDDSVRTPESDSGSGGSGGSSGADLAERLGLTWLKKSNRSRYQMIRKKVQAYMKKYKVNAKKALKKLGYGHLSRF